MLLSKFGFKYNKAGVLTRKPVSELNNSLYYVHVKCDQCEKKYKTLWSNRVTRFKNGITSDFCSSCSKRGNKNSQYGKDRTEYMRYALSFVKNFSRNFTNETKSKMSKTRSHLIANGTVNMVSINRGKKSWYYSPKNNEWFYSDSLLERFRMEQLDNDTTITSWTKRHGIKVAYKYKGVTKYCVPDFLINYEKNIVIEEVKGRVTELELIKKQAISDFCNENKYDFCFLTQKELNCDGLYRKYINNFKDKKI